MNYIAFVFSTQKYISGRARVRITAVLNWKGLELKDNISPHYHFDFNNVGLNFSFAT